MNDFRLFLEAEFHPETKEKLDAGDYHSVLEHYAKENPERRFVTYTKINKVGMNPQSTYDTPIGIYTYPINYVIEMQNRGVKFPPIHQVNYVHVLELDQNSNLINLNFDYQQYPELKQMFDNWKNGLDPIIEEKGLKKEVIGRLNQALQNLSYHSNPNVDKSRVDKYQSRVNYALQNARDAIAATDKKTREDDKYDPKLYQAIKILEEYLESLRPYLKDWKKREGQTDQYPIVQSNLNPSSHEELLKQHASKFNRNFDKTKQDVIDKTVLRSDNSMAWAMPLLWSLKRYNLKFDTFQSDNPPSKKKIKSLWANYFVKMGIDGFIDNGTGTIHHNEPVQAVFFNMKKIKVLDTLRLHKNFVGHKWEMPTHWLKDEPWYNGARPKDVGNKNKSHMHPSSFALSMRTPRKDRQEHVLNHLISKINSDMYGELKGWTRMHRDRPMDMEKSSNRLVKLFHTLQKNKLSLSDDNRKSFNQVIEELKSKHPEIARKLEKF